MIVIDVDKAKTITHAKRRVKRSDNFKTVDGDIVYAQLNEAGQALRAEIKTADDSLQFEIDAASTVEELKMLIARESL